MASPDDKDDGGKDPGKTTSKRTDLLGEEAENSTKWSETCIGVWTRSTEGRDVGGKTEMVCTGINLVRIGKEVDISQVAPSQTRGVQVTITEMSDKSVIVKDEDVGADGVIGYRPPLRTRNKAGQENQHQPTPIENLVMYFLEKKDRLVKRVANYREDPSQMTEIWGEFIDGSKRQYQTGKRLVSYCKPKETYNHMYNFASERIKGVQAWIEEYKKGKG